MFKIDKTTSTIIEWYMHYKKNNINFNPPYQRIGGIWNLANKQLLIDSILNNLDIPKFYVNYFFNKGNNLNEQEKLYAIIDGKQRFLTIFEFMEDKFPLSKDFALFDYPDVNLKELKYSEIGLYYPHIKHLFDNYKLDIALVITDESERIDELFLRLNEGKQLNNAEKRYAVIGDLSNELKKFVQYHHFFNKLSFNDKRYDYFDLVTKLFLLDINEGELVSLNKKNLDSLLKQNRVMTNTIEVKLDKFSYNLTLFAKIFKEKDFLLNSKSKIPLYYLFFKEYMFVESDIIYSFLKDFEELVLENRVSFEYDEILLEFDRLTQQGTTSKGSLENRLRILESYFNSFINQKEKKMEVISVPVDFEDI